MEMAIRGPIVKIPEVLFWYRQYASRTEDDRARRQGSIPDESRVLRAKYTYLQESLTGVVLASSLPRGMKLVVAADVLRAAYLEDTPLSRHARREVPVRLRSAVHDRDLGAFLKFAPLATYAFATRLARRLLRSLGRRSR